jgi:hypothetical protein
MEDVGGDYTDYMNDAELRNAPNVTSYSGNWVMTV